MVRKKGTMEINDFNNYDYAQAMAEGIELPDIGELIDPEETANLPYTADLREELERLHSEMSVPAMTEPPHNRPSE